MELWKKKKSFCFHKKLDLHLDLAFFVKADTYL